MFDPFKLVRFVNTSVARLPKVMSPAIPVSLPYQLERVTPEGVRYTPTLLPDGVYRWADKKVMTEGVQNFSLGDLEVIHIDDVFDVEQLDIVPSPIFPQFGKVLSDEDVIEKVKEENPVDDTEIVEWMHEATAVNVVLTAREAEFNRHSLMRARGGDGNIPGVYVAGMSFQRVNGYVFYRRGYAIAFYPRGSVRVNRGSSADVISSDFLGWAATAPHNYGVQWIGVLARFVQIPGRITRSVGFMTTLGRTAPLYTAIDPGDRTRRCEVRMVFVSDRNQSMKVTFRDPNDYRNVIDEDTINIRRGTNEVRFVVASYPAVPPAINHVQPSHGSRTTFSRFEVRRMD